MGGMSRPERDLDRTEHSDSQNLRTEALFVSVQHLPIHFENIVSYPIVKTLSIVKNCFLKGPLRSFYFIGHVPEYRPFSTQISYMNIVRPSIVLYPFYNKYTSLFLDIRGYAVNPEI